MGGFPTQNRFRYSGSADDVFWSMTLGIVCGKVTSPQPTITYWNHPGSNFEKQNAKFQMSREQWMAEAAGVAEAERLAFDYEALCTLVCGMD